MLSRFLERWSTAGGGPLGRQQADPADSGSTHSVPPAPPLSEDLGETLLLVSMV